MNPTKDFLWRKKGQKLPYLKGKKLKSPCLDNKFQHVTKT